MDKLLYILLVLIVTFPVLGKKFYIKANLPGVALSFLIAVPAWLLGQKIPIIGGPVLGIVFGILAAFLKRPESFGRGIKETSKKVLQAAIVLFGFEMNLMRVWEVGARSLALMMFTILSALLTAYFVSRALKIDSKVATLVGVGTSICGGSAIAATAPVIKAGDKEVASSISTIFFFNVIAVFVFPFLGHALGMGDTGFGMWAGTAINDTSSVVAAGYSYSDAAGDLATIVKLTRTLMIVPITFVLALYTSKKTRSTDKTFNILKVFPWFILGFIAACLVNTLGFVPAVATEFLGKAGKFMIVAAMAAIGLNTNLGELVRNGKKSLILGAICWFVVSATSLIVQKAMGIL